MRLMLEVMLFGLATVLRRNSKRPSVQAKLRDRNRTVQVRTRDGSVARYFVFLGDTVLSRRGVLEHPDVSFVWKDAEVAARILRSADAEALQGALADESLSIVGDAGAALWFGDVVRTARAQRPDANEVMPTVAVMGLGRMGSGIAQSLLRAGFQVVVYNRTEEKTRPLVEAGATAAATPAAAARGARFIVTSLMNDASVFAVVEGPDGMLAGLDGGAIHLGASTISAEATGRLARLHARLGHAYLATPVVGRPEAAASGELVAFVCGERAAYEASRPVLHGFTRQAQYLGEDHAVAIATKLAVNYSAATLIDLMGQVYAFGEKAGIPLTGLHTMFRMMWAQPVLQGYATRIWRREFDEVGFDLRGGLKDVTLMLDASKAQGVRWDFAEPIHRKMVRGIDMGLGARDWASTYEVTRAEAGLGT